MCDILEDKKAEDIVILDVEKLTWITDFIVIASGETYIQTQAIAQTLMEKLDKSPFSVEGFETSWILLDYGDVIVNIFLPAIRQFYNLEKLWADAERVNL
ncbi:MAG TPA: ribosome silencing factor [bacterium]|nr:ribosome silencing factor [bacterium]